MRSKAPLAMLEQLVMLLVFALAAALCLQAFVLADEISADSARQDRAVLEVQKAAEIVKHCRGDWALAADLLQADRSGSTLQLDAEDGVLTVTPAEAPTALLHAADIAMYSHDGSLIFDVQVVWQNGGGQ